MSKEGTLFTVGIVTIISPYLGLPDSWLKVLLPVLGIIILMAGYTLRRERSMPTPHIPATPSHTPPPEVPEEPLGPSAIA